MRTARPVLGVALAAVVVAVGAAPAQADSAALDPSFGTGGVVTTPFAGNNAIPFDLAIDAQSRIVVVGEAQSPHVIALARYLSNGSLDPTFGGGTGKVTTPSGTSARADGVAIQADGSIVVAGSDLVGGNSEVLVARYLPSGTLDPGFASGGIFKSPAAGVDAAAVTVQPDGAVVVAGRPPSPSSGFEVLRLTPGGALDPTFDGDGIATVYNDAGNCGDNASSGPGRVIIQPDASIIAGGVCGGRNGTLQTFGLVRLISSPTGPNGALDTAFGAGGAAVAGIEGGKAAFGNDFARQSDGKLVEVGQSGFGNVDARSGVARWNADGSLDGSFGSGGVLAFDIPGATRSRAFGVALEPGGRILIGGDLNPSAGFGLTGLTPNGGFDGTFAPGGQIFTPFGEPAGPSGIVRQSDGKVVEAGFDEPGGNDLFALVRYLVPQPAAPSPSPPGAGSTTPPGTVPTLPAVQLGPVSLVAATFDGRRVHLTLACGAASACDGVVSLAAAAPRQAKLRASAAKHKRKPRRPRTVSLGSSPFSMAAGARGTLTLRPSSKGAALLRRHRRVRATATFVNAATGERKTSSVSVTSTKHKKPKHRH
jgi:uncharacterized delta-60 repeat protein